MRFRKARGKKKAVVTMTEDEVVEACSKYLTEKGVETGDVCWLKINVSPKATRRRVNRVEFVSEIRGDIETGPL